MGSRVWFTSDVHLGHRYVAETRGYTSVTRHDQDIAAIWTSQVRPGDQVWVLGDLAVSAPANALTILAALPGEKHLVWGNHDQGHPMYRDAHRKARQYGTAFASAQAFARRRVNGRSVLLSHFPYDGDTPGRDGDRHVEYRLRPAGLPLIHGHTHSTERTSRALTGELQVHVGWDAWRELVPLEEIAGIVAAYDEGQAR